MNKKDKLILSGLLLLSLIPFWQWFNVGIPKTHDLLLQIARIASFSQGLREGNIFPRWGGNLNWGYGHPSLMFLYPLTSYIGGLLTLTGLSFVTATKLTFGLAAVAAAAGMYIFLRRMFSAQAAAFGTFLYLLAPYRLVDINVRGALGELAGLAVIPWVFWRFWELIVNPNRKNIGWAGLSIFLLILAHNAVGLMGLGMLAIWVISFNLGQISSLAKFARSPSPTRYRSGQAPRPLRGLGVASDGSSLTRKFTNFANLFGESRLIAAVIALGLGFGLAAFYWIPGIIESKYTFQKEFTNLEIYTSRFPAPKELLVSPWGYGPTSENGRPAGFTVSAGWAAIGALVVVIPALSWNLYRDRFRVPPSLAVRLQELFVHGSRSAIRRAGKSGMTSQIQVIQTTITLSFLVIFLIAIFFLTPLSLGGVKYLGIIQRFQFPWRFLAMTVVAGAVMGAAVVGQMGKRWIWAAGLLGLVAIWQARPGFFIQGYEDLNPADETFSGPVAWTTDTGESTPRWATRFQDKFPKSQLEVVWGADIDYQVLERKNERHRFIVDAKVPTQVADNTLYFPGWKVTVNGQEVPIEYQDQNWRGLITFPVPAGRSEVEVEFTMTAVRKAAAAISLASFAMLAILLTIDDRR